MSTPIESLELQIQSSSTSAINGIDALSASLSKLKNATKGGLGLLSLSNHIKDFNNNLDNSSLYKIDMLINSLSKLSQFKDLKISSTIGNQLKNITSVTANVTDLDLSNMDRLYSSLNLLSNMGNAKGLKSIINQLERLPKLVNVLNSLNWDRFTNQLRTLSSEFEQLNNKLNSVSNVVNKFPANFSKLSTSINEVGKTYNNASFSWINFWAKVRIVKNIIKKAANLIGTWVSESNRYVENLNLFDATMGKYAESSKQYAEKIGDLMGIDPGEWMRSEGVFNTIITGFGVVSDRANIMSKNLTQLGYDLSSFFNISFADSMQKLTSGISGELEPLRRLGYDLSQARLKAVALSLGIDKSFNSMTQAEKAQLRYYAIMKQVTVAQGDMARTLNAPANQLRILQAQVIQVSRALGNVFIPVLTAVLPYIIAFVKLIRMAINAIASLFGFKLPEFDYSGIKAGSDAVGSLGDNANDAGKGLGKAAKGAEKLKNALLGIDELNIISENKGASGGAGGGGVGGIGGSDFGFELPTYDFFKNIVSSKVDEIIDIIKKSMTEIEVVLGTFLLVLGTILVVSGVNIPVGLGLMAIGAAELVKTIVVNWNSMSDNLAKVLTIITAGLSSFFFTIGLILALSGNLPLGIALMVLGATSFVTAIVINWKFLQSNIKNIISILETIIGVAFLTIGAILTFSGSNIPLGVGLLAVGALKIVSAIALNWNIMPNNIKKIVNKINNILSIALLTIGAILVFTGVKLPLGVGLLATGAIGLANSVMLDKNTILNMFTNILKKIGIILGSALLAIGMLLVLSGVMLPLGIGLIVSGLAVGAAGIALNWGKITDWIKGELTNIMRVVGWGMAGLGTILLMFGMIPLGLKLIAAGAGVLIGSLFTSPPATNKDITSEIHNFLEEGKKAGKEFGINFKTGLNDGLYSLDNDIASKINNSSNYINPVNVEIKDNSDNWFKNISNLINNKTKDLEVKTPVKLEKKEWSTVKNWIGNIQPVQQKVELEKSKWSTVKNWVGHIPTLSQGISLLKSGWSTVKNWVGYIPVVSQGVSLFKSGWNTVKSWIGDHTVSTGISLYKSGWKTISSWVGNKVSVDVSLRKDGWFSLKSFFGLSSGGYDTGHGFKLFKKGGFINSNGKSGFWKSIPMYRNGTANAGLHGSLFVAGEAGAEMVGHINGQTEVLNQSQIKLAMRSAVISGMAQFTGYFKAIYNQIAAGANAMVHSILINTEVLSAAIIKGYQYDPTNSLSQTVYDDSQKAYNRFISNESMARTMREFYKEYVEPTLREIASDTKRQADKEEQTIVQIGNRTITDAVVTQKRANGFVFDE